MLLLLLGLASAGTIAVTNVGWSFVNVYAIDAGDGVVLVDTHYPRHADRIVRRLERHGIAPDRVRLIVLTHAHSDHAGSAAALRETIGAPIAVGAGDAGELRAGRFGEARPTTAFAAVLKPFFVRDQPPTAPDLVVDGSLSLADHGVPGEAHVTGGHTPGSLVVRLDDGTVLVGDLIRGGLTAPRRPKRHFLHVDEAAADAALAVELDCATAILPGHGGPIPPDRVRRYLERRAR